MENRRDELEKFAYVFNYKIRELTSQIGPRQYEVQALIEQFNNVNNFIYSIFYSFYFYFFRWIMNMNYYLKIMKNIQLK
jgi:hypothetical protein